MKKCSIGLDKFMQVETKMNANFNHKDFFYLYRRLIGTNNLLVKSVGKVCTVPVFIREITCQFSFDLRDSRGAGF